MVSDTAKRLVAKLGLCRVFLFPGVALRPGFMVPGKGFLTFTLSGALLFAGSCYGKTLINGTSEPLLVSSSITGTNWLVGSGGRWEVATDAFSCGSPSGGVVSLTAAEFPEVGAVWGSSLVVLPVFDEGGKPAVRGAAAGFGFGLCILGAAWGIRLALGAFGVREDIA